MPIIKKNWAKKLLIIDIRPIQKFQYNGVNIAGINWISELIKQSKKDQPIFLWSNQKTIPNLPKSWLGKKNVKHIHTNLSNLRLLLTNFLNLGKPLEKLLKINQQYIYFTPDLRSIQLGELCIKRCTYFHDIAFHKFPKHLSLKSRLWFKLIQPHKIYQKSDQIITNSEFSKKEIKKLYGKHHNTIKIVHPSLPKKLKNSNHKIELNNYYLFIGTIQKRKQLNFLINHIPSTKKLAIIGNQDPMFSKSNLNLKKNIIFLGPLTNEHKYSYIKNCKALLYPSRYEGFGIPILEAIRLKKPVYTFQIPPYTNLFQKQISNIKNLKKPPSPITKPNLFPLKKEVRKLRSILYNLD